MANWTKEECILGLYAYCHVPFNKASNTNEWIIRVANLINRTPAAVKMKIGNFGSFDPFLRERGIVGLTSISKMDKVVWDEYHGNWDKLAFDAENIIAAFENRDVSQNLTLPAGAEVLVEAKHRINQNFFRATVLSSYNNTCCISGVSNEPLLEACHIIPWIENESLRTDPTNGLCMNPLFHKAYDDLLFSISPDFIISISDIFVDCCVDNGFRDFLRTKNNTKIIMPTRFLPNRDLLSLHYDNYIVKHL